MLLPSLSRLLLLALALGLAFPAEAERARERDRGPFLSTVGATNLAMAQRDLAEGRLDSALARANRALASDPDSGEVHAMLGLVHARLGDQNKAKRAFERAVRHAPDSGPVLNVYAAWLCETGRAEEAEAHFLAALEDPQYRTPEQAMGNAGDCALRSNDAAKAEQYYRRGLARAPENPLLLTRMAQLTFKQGDMMRARAFLQRRDAAVPLDRELLELAIQIEEQAGDRAAAERYRNRLRELAQPQPPTGEGPRTP